MYYFYFQFKKNEISLDFFFLQVLVPFFVMVPVPVLYQTWSRSFVPVLDQTWSRSFVPVIFLVPALVPVPVPSYFWFQRWSRFTSIRVIVRDQKDLLILKKYVNLIRMPHFHDFTCLTFCLLHYISYLSFKVNGNIWKQIPSLGLQTISSPEMEVFVSNTNLTILSLILIDP